MIGYLVLGVFYAIGMTVFALIVSTYKEYEKEAFKPSYDDYFGLILIIGSIVWPVGLPLLIGLAGGKIIKTVHDHHKKKKS